MNISRSPDNYALPEILHALAFMRQDYTSETIDEMKQSLISRGYGDRQIQSWREQFLSVKTAKLKCEECKDGLILDYEDLVRGSFACPLCQHQQQIDYRALDRKAFDPRLVERLGEISATEMAIDLNDTITDDKLIGALALNKHKDFGDTYDYLKYLFVIRKFTNEDLIAWRQDNIDVGSIETNCRKCGNGIQPTRDELIAGEHSCPHCHSVQLIEYRTPAARKPVPKTTVEENIGQVNISLHDANHYSDTEIFEALAMRENEYSPESQESLKQALVSRGFTMADVDAWRDGDPLSTEDRAPKPEIGKFKHGGLLTKNLIGFYVVLIAVSVIDMLFSLRFIGGNDIADPGPLVILAAVLMFLALINIPILFLQWFYRVHKNLSYLEVKPRKYRPMFAIAGFLIPVASFFFPYFIGREIIESSLPVDHNASPVPKDRAISSLRMWWGAYLLMILFIDVSLFIDSESFLTTAGLPRAVYNIITIAAAFYAIRFIRIVDKLQREKHRIVDLQVS